MLSTIVWTCVVYLTLWLLPEPVSKGLAAAMTVALIAWLGVGTLWSLMDGWATLVVDVNKATSFFAHVRAASDRFGRTLGDNTATGSDGMCQPTSP
ncbi:MAG: hypothetical protein JXB05_32125 [Myxococcaceae bacterium]|nr:hypothetical protein [Myxococcaceae bacterium]